MTDTKTTLAWGLLAAATLAAPAAFAELTANVSATNNYIWRGVTQTNDQAAIQGGLDYTHESGLYAGTWVSNVDFGDAASNDTGVEVDLYAGYAGETGAFSYDLGLLHYAYPVHDDLDFTELYVGAGTGPFSALVAYTIDTDAGGDDANLYYSAGLEFELTGGYGLGLTLGHYDFDDQALEDYSHYQIALSKGEFTLAVDKNDLDDADLEDPRFVVSWSKEF